MNKRCQCLGLIAGLTLALGVSAATEWSSASPVPVMAVADSGALPVLAGDEPLPAPVPLLLLAVSLVGLAAALRWRRRSR